MKLYTKKKLIHSYVGINGSEFATTKSATLPNKF